MTKNIKGRLTVLAFSLMSAILLLEAGVWIAQAESWAAPAITGPQQIWRATLRARPNDGVAYILGDSGSGSGGFPANALIYVRSNSLGTYEDIDDDGANNDTKYPHVAFSADSTGYAVWRAQLDGYIAYMRKIAPSGLVVERGVDISGKIRLIAGANLDQPDIAINRNTGKMYVTGQVQYSPVVAWGVAESSDNGNTFTNFQLIKDNRPAGVDVVPRICVDNNDNLHVVGRWDTNIYARSRINGVWGAFTKLTDSSSLNYMFRGDVSIACAPDGNAYTVFLGPNSTNTRNGIGFARYVPGSGWQPAKFDIQGSSGSSALGRIGADITTSSDGRIWVGAGANRGTSGGTNVLRSSDNGATFINDLAIPPPGAGGSQTDDEDNEFVGIDYAGALGRIHVMGTFKANSEGNGIRQSRYSYADIVVAPAAPTALVASPLNSNAVRLTWVDNSTNETGFLVQRRVGAGAYADLATVGANINTYQDNTVVPGESYAYRVQARAAAGASAFSNEAIVSPPIAPSNLRSVATEYNRVVLAWNDNSANEVNFIVEKQIGAGAFVPIAIVGANVTTITDNGVSANTAYAYRVQAYNGAYSAYSNVLNVTTPPNPLPANPSNLNATAFSSKQINLTWTDNSNNEQNFVVERKTGAAGTYVQIIVLGANVTSYQDNTLTATTTYFYRVRAFNLGIYSGYTNEASTTTLGVSTLRADTLPSNVEAGATFGLTISVRDNVGNLVPNFIGSIAISMSPRPGATLGGTLIANVVNGVATFSNLTIDAIGTGYQLVATIQGSSPTINLLVPTFNVSGRLAFTTLLPNLIANGAFTITVDVRKADQTIATTYNGPVSLAISVGSGVPGAILSRNGNSTVVVNAVNGVATFDNLKIDRVGGAYILVATSTEPLKAASSQPFNVVANLDITLPTATIIANRSFTVTVTVRDVVSATLTNYNGPVYLVGFAGSVSNTILSGPRAANAVNGVATFRGIAIDRVGAGYTLNFQLPNGSPMASAIFVVTAEVGCNTLLVNSLADSTTDDTASCNITLRGALSRAVAGDTIRFDTTILSTTQTIFLIGTNLSVANGISIDGGCGSTGPNVQLSLTTGVQLTLTGNNTLRGIRMTGGTLSMTGTNNSVSCFRRG